MSVKQMSFHKCLNCAFFYSLADQLLFCIIVTRTLKVVKNCYKIIPVINWDASNVLRMSLDYKNKKNRHKAFNFPECVS